ncbi:hypothetical protein K7G98_13890 [Saccharothrix sp. MB29]|nr:hypothetical protein [Saccharothrix sp. MB29]
MLIDPGVALHGLLEAQEAVLAYQQGRRPQPVAGVEHARRVRAGAVDQGEFPDQRVLGAEAVQCFADSLADNCTSR